ncbi:hypothetical protein [Alteriqipengyuania sp. 357]
MRLAFCMIAGASLALAACSQEADEPAEDSAPQAAAVDQTAEAPVQADSGLREWIVGTWSYDGTCASDFAVFYEADGTMHNDGEAGSWDVSGDTLTETITEEFEMGEPGVTKVDPPRVRALEVAMIDEDRGNLIFEGDTYEITRC